MKMKQEVARLLTEDEIAELDMAADIAKIDPLYAVGEDEILQELRSKLQQDVARAIARRKE